MLVDLLKLTASFKEKLILMGGETVKIITVTSYKMRKDRTGYHCGLMLETFYQCRHVMKRVKAQTVHARIQFDMNREVGYTFLFCLADQCIQQTETVDFRFKIIFKEGLEAAHLRIHDNDIGLDARLTQIHAFVGNRYSQIIDLVILQCLGNLNGSGTIGRSLDHTNHLGFRLEKATVIIQVIHHGIKVNLQDRLMDLAFQQIGQLVKPERTRTFDQYHILMQMGEPFARQQFRRCTEEITFHRKEAMKSRQLRSYTDKAFHTATFDQTGHFFIEYLGILSGLLDITQNQHSTTSLTVRTTVHEVERNIQ